MVILGVDPGTVITGFAVLSRDKGKLSLLHSDIITQKSSTSMPVRLKTIYDKLSEVINTFLPDEFAIETVFMGKNVQSALKIGQARGVSILAAVNHQIPTIEYSPREIKKAITGSGSASKQQVMYMVNQILEIQKDTLKFDETDAIAIALCHLQKFSVPVKQYRNWKDFVEENPKKVLL